MADETLGGLGTVAAIQAEAPVEEVKAPSPAAKPGLDDYLAKVQKQQEESFAALDARRKKLLELGSARKNQMFDPQMLAVSSALLRPTKTGGFGESLGYATEALGAEQEKRLQREQAEAKLQMELEQMTQDQKSKILEDQLVMSMFGGNKGAPVAGAGGVPAVGAGEAPAGGVQSTGMLENMTDQQLMILSRTNPKVATTALSILDNRRKAEELGLKKRETATKEASVKRFLPGVGAVEMPIDFWNKLESAKSFDEISELYKSKNLPLNLTDTEDGGKRFMTSEEIEYEKEKKKARLTEEPKKYTLPELGRNTYELLPSEYRDRNAAKAQGDQALQTWWDKNHPEFNVQIPGAKKAGKAGKAGVEDEEGVESSEARDVRIAREKKVAEQRAVSEVKGRDEIISNAKAADRLSIPAKAIYDLAKDPIRGKALGLLEDPTVADAFMGVVAEGAQVGQYNVGIPAIRSAVAKLAGNNPEEAGKIMSALQMLAKNFSIIELNLTRMYLQGEGAITEGERAIVRNISGGVGTRRDVAMSQAEMFMQRADFDKKVKSEMLKWEKANPNKSFDEFGESTVYKNLWSQFNQNMDKVFDKYYGEKKGATAAKPSESAKPAAPVLGGELPPAAAKQVVEGQNTTFSNGQVWTRRDGKLVRVK